MLNMYLFFSLIFIQNILACELMAPKKKVTNLQDLQKFCDHMKSVNAVINMAVQAVDVANFITSQIAPSEEEIDAQELCEYKIKRLSTEANFHKCLIKNAFQTKGENRLPMSCQIAAIEFIDTNGLNAFKELRDEFITVTSEFDENGQPLPKGWSLSTKIALGIFIVGTAGAGAIILTPILFPGTAAATQAQNIINTTQTIGTSLSEIVQAQVTQKMAELSASKLAAASTGIGFAIKARKLVYATQAEKLAMLEDKKKARPSLTTQIKSLYTSNNALSTSLTNVHQ